MFTKKIKLNPEILFRVATEDILIKSFLFFLIKGIFSKGYF